MHAQIIYNQDVAGTGFTMQMVDSNKRLGAHATSIRCAAWEEVKDFRDGYEAHRPLHRSYCHGAVIVAVVDMLPLRVAVERPFPLASLNASFRLMLGRSSGTMNETSTCRVEPEYVTCDGTERPRAVNACDAQHGSSVELVAANKRPQCVVCQGSMHFIAFPTALLH